MKKPATAAERRHMNAVAGLGCIVCGAEACIHHLRTDPITGKVLGMSQRANHFHTIPLCPKHHTDGGYGVAFHAGSRQWQANYGTEVELFAKVQGKLSVRR